MVGEAGDGEAALRMVAQLVPDVVVLDLMMPRLNGSETARAILRDYSTSTSVLLLSALARQPGSPEHREAVAALPAGVFELYEKPTLVGAVAEAKHQRTHPPHPQPAQPASGATAKVVSTVTHAAAAGFGDRAWRFDRGLDALRQVLERLRPPRPLWSSLSTWWLNRRRASWLSCSHMYPCRWWPSRVCKSCGVGMSMSPRSMGT